LNPTAILIYVFFFHWIADFPAQTGWMAINKSSNFRALVTHVLTYASVLTLGVILTFGFSPEAILSFFLVNFFAHIATDVWTSKLSSSMSKQGKTSAFFSVIGFDQFIHAATLILTTKYILGVS
jgi:hypothetical protein